tara:strand:- start:12419 stop:14053 length:1635 start_codon:yes stop_codon:yes gene_type:complete
MKSKITSLFSLLFFSLLTIISFAQSSNELVRITTVDNLAALNSISGPYSGSLAFVESQNSIFQFTGASWQPFGNTWTLNTNKNISPEKFIGTLDSNSFVVRSNDSHRMSVNGDGQVLISKYNTISENAAIEIGSGGSIPKMTTDTTPAPYRIIVGGKEHDEIFNYLTTAWGSFSNYAAYQEYPNHPQHLAFDDDPNTYWKFKRFDSNHPPSQWALVYSHEFKAALIVDFGTPTYIKGIKMTTGPNRLRIPHNVVLQGSDEYPMEENVQEWRQVNASPSTYGWQHLGQRFKWFFSNVTGTWQGASPVLSYSPNFTTNWQSNDYANNREHTFLYDSPLPHRYWMIFMDQYNFDTTPMDFIEFLQDTILPIEHTPFFYNITTDHIEVGGSTNRDLWQRYYEISELDFILPSFTVTKEGLTGISNSRPSHKLHINGSVLASGSITPDYVFEKEFEGKSDRKPDYVLMSLEEVERFTKQHNHLPNVPSAQEVNNQGGVIINQSVEINLEKIEELFLHIIEMNEEVQQLQAELEELQQQKKSSIISKELK